MTVQLRDLTHRESSYIDEQGKYCEIWSSEDDYDSWPDSIEGFVTFFEGLIE